MNHEQQQQQNLELVLNNIASPEARTYLRTAVAELLALGFTHCGTDGWVSPLQRQPLRQALTFDAARLLLHAAALELSRSGKFAMGQVVNDAVHVVAPLPPHDKEARDEAEAAVRTLEHLGYTYHGAVYWKPPVGKAPAARQEAAWLGTPKDGSRPSVTINHDTLGDWQRFGRTIEPLYRARDLPTAQDVDMEQAHQLAYEIGGVEGGTYAFDPDELEHFIGLLLAVKP